MIIRLLSFFSSVIIFTFGVITNLGAACTDRWYQVPFWEKAYYSNVHFFMFLLRSKYLLSFHQSFHIKKTFPLKTRERRWICWIWANLLLISCLSTRALKKKDSEKRWTKSLWTRKYREEKKPITRWLQWQIHDSCPKTTIINIH